METLHSTNRKLVISGSFFCVKPRKLGWIFVNWLDIPQDDRRKYHDDVTVTVISLEGRIWKSSGKIPLKPFMNISIGDNIFHIQVKLKLSFHPPDEAIYQKFGRSNTDPHFKGP